jgi:hypothetical protein
MENLIGELPAHKDQEEVSTTIPLDLDFLLPDVLVVVEVMSHLLRRDRQPGPTDDNN